MERAVFESQLKAAGAPSVCFELATERDDAQIRRLLRDNPMRGQITLSLEREPSFFADANLPGETKQIIVAREGGRIICVGSCVTRMRSVGREQRQVGYLAGLRLEERFGGRFDILRGGYKFFRELQHGTAADLYFTSIAADNQRARRFLERGLPGLPRYQFAGEFRTVLLRVLKRELKTRFCTGGAPLDEIAAFLNEHTRQFALAPSWTPLELAALSQLGLGQDDFQVVRSDGRIVACGALWDQRSFKQTVVRGYTGWLSGLRPIINLGASLTGRPRWPEAGATVPHAFISHLAIAPNQADALIELISTLSDAARRRKIELLTLGFAANDTRLATVLARFPCREYRSRIYLVYWPESIGGVPDLTTACLAPEVALL